MPMTPFRARQILGCLIGDPPMQRQLYYNRIRRILEGRLARALNAEVAVWIRYDMDQLAQALDTLDHEEERLTRGCPEPGDGVDPKELAGPPCAFPSDPRGHRPDPPYVPRWARRLADALLLVGLLLGTSWVVHWCLAHHALLVRLLHLHAP